MNSKELERELEKLGATFKAAKGSHFRVYLNGHKSICPCTTKTSDHWNTASASNSVLRS